MNDRRFVFLMILDILLCFLILLVPIDARSIPLLSTTASLLAAATLLVSLRSLQKTGKILTIIETEQKIRDTRESLNLFYYSLNDFIERIQIPIPSIQDIENATKYKYLATEETRKQLEILQQNNYVLDPENYKTKSKVLLEYVKKDIAMLENDLLAERLQY